MKKLMIGVLLVFSLIALASASTSCTNDGGIRCPTATSIQICTNWDNTGMKWGYCSNEEVNFCVGQSNPASCLSACVDNKVILTIGRAINDFGFQVTGIPQPPQVIWNSQYSCENGYYYEARCLQNEIAVTGDRCIYGCDGNKCKNIVRKCDPTGKTECVGASQVKTCLNTGSGNSDWGQPQNCSAGESCSGGVCGGNPNPPFNFKTPLIIAGSAITLFGILWLSIGKKKGKRR